MSEQNQTIPIRRPSISASEFNASVVQSDISVKSKESKYPTEIVPLPTRGYFYSNGHVLSSGEVEIKQMSAKEEDLLANEQLIKTGKVLDKLMESVLVNKSIKVEDILIPDKNAIFIALRRLAYGNDYNVSVTCPVCSVQNKVCIDLGELKYKPFDFDNCQKGNNNFTFKLPHSGVVLTYKLLNQLDEKSIEAELNQIRKISKENTAEITTRLKYAITSVDGNLDKIRIRKFIEEEFTAMDSLKLRKHMREHNPDVDMMFDFKCKDCDHERRIDVPLGSSFLFPDIDS